MNRAADLRDRPPTPQSPPAARQELGRVAVVSRCAWTLYNFRGNLIRRLQAEGGDVVALGAELDGFGVRLVADGIDFRHVPVPRKGLAPIGDILLLWKLFVQFRRLRPQIVHTFTVKATVYGMLAARAAGVPVRVSTITGLGHAFTQANRLVNTLVRTLYRVSLAQCHVVFFQNPEDARYFVDQKLVSAGQVELVAGSGVDLEHFRQKPFRPGLGARPLRFLMVARLLREKGVVEFCEAAEQVIQAGLKAEFRIVGGADSRNPTALSRQEMDRLAASPVEVAGYTHDIAAELEAADVVVLPSYREGLPRSLLEAMAIGRPIITTDTVGCRELVEHGVNGYMVPIKDAPALAEAMKLCFEDPGRLTAMADASRVKAETGYSEEFVISTILAAYETARNRA